MENKKSYFAIIPANVRYDKRLNANSKLLYGEISALCNEKGFCWASNSYFSELYEVSTTSISSWIKRLKDSGYITIKLIYKEGTKEILHRYISILSDPPQENLQTLPKKTCRPYTRKLIDPIQENLQDNNTINNTINNTKNNTKNKKGKGSFQPPSFFEVEEYINLKGFSINPKTFFEYFHESNWIDSRGNKVKNWKQKLITWNSHTQSNKKPTQETPQETLKRMQEQYG